MHSQVAILIPQLSEKSATISFEQGIILCRISSTHDHCWMVIWFIKQITGAVLWPLINLLPLRSNLCSLLSFVILEQDSVTFLQQAQHCRGPRGDFSPWFQGFSSFPWCGFQQSASLPWTLSQPVVCGWPRGRHPLAGFTSNPMGIFPESSPYIRSRWPFTLLSNPAGGFLTTQPRSAAGRRK